MNGWPFDRLRASGDILHQFKYVEPLVFTAYRDGEGAWGCYLSRAIPGRNSGKPGWLSTAGTMLPSLEHASNRSKRNWAARSEPQAFAWPPDSVSPATGTRSPCRGSRVRDSPAQNWSSVSIMRIGIGIGYDKGGLGRRIFRAAGQSTFHLGNVAVVNVEDGGVGLAGPDNPPVPVGGGRPGPFPTLSAPGWSHAGPACGRLPIVGWVGIREPVMDVPHARAFTNKVNLHRATVTESNQPR